MISFKTVIAICLGATLCTAQTINISGVVQDSAGVGIVGATVKLEKANVSATSGAGGVFKLTWSATSTDPLTALSAMTANLVQFRNGKITFSLAGNTPVGISVHDVGGRQMFSSKRTLGSGTHTLSVPTQTGGIFLCNVTIGHGAYSFKASSFGASSKEQAVVSRGTPALAKQAQATAATSDVIAATSPGMLNYRCVIGNSDTSGVVIKMIANAGDVTDADGNVYQSVRIGNQVWTVENLRTTKHNDGTAIPLVTGDSAWAALTTPGRCWYYNDSASNHATFGALYNWYAVNTGKLAPEGWRVPTDAEWTTLENHLIASGYNWDGNMSGNKIAKSMAAQTDWISWTTAGTIGNDLVRNNASGFSALPSGCRYDYGGFGSRWYCGFWWSATELSASAAYIRSLVDGDERLCRAYNGYDGKRSGFSVRLLRD